jgi:hypothetical protein
LFVIDPGGVIRWSYVSPVGINPGADGILKALAAMVQGKKGLPTAQLSQTRSKEEA